MESQQLQNLINESIITENQSVDIKLFEQILEKIYSYTEGAKDTCVIIEKLLRKKNLNVQIHTLELLDYCMTYGSIAFQSQISSKQFMNTFLGLIFLKDINQNFLSKALKLVQKWANSGNFSPNISKMFKEIYQRLINCNFSFPEGEQGISQVNNQQKKTPVKVPEKVVQVHQTKEDTQNIAISNPHVQKSVTSPSKAPDPKLINKIKEFEVVEDNIILTNEMISSYWKDPSTSIDILHELIRTLKTTETKVQNLSKVSQEEMIKDIIGKITIDLHSTFARYQKAMKKQNPGNYVSAFNSQIPPPDNKFSSPKIIQSNIRENPQAQRQNVQKNSPSLLNMNGNENTEEIKGQNIQRYNEPQATHEDPNKQRRINQPKSNPQLASKPQHPSNQRFNQNPNKPESNFQNNNELQQNIPDVNNFENEEEIQMPQSKFPNKSQKINQQQNRNISNNNRDNEELSYLQTKQPIQRKGEVSKSQKHQFRGQEEQINPQEVQMPQNVKQQKTNTNTNNLLDNFILEPIKEEPKKIENLNNQRQKLLPQKKKEENVMIQSSNMPKVAEKNENNSNEDPVFKLTKIMENMNYQENNSQNNISDFSNNQMFFPQNNSSFMPMMPMVPMMTMFPGMNQMMYSTFMGMQGMPMNMNFPKGNNSDPFGLGNLMLSPNSQNSPNLMQGNLQNINSSNLNYKPEKTIISPSKRKEEPKFKLPEKPVPKEFDDIFQFAEQKGAKIPNVAQPNRNFNVDIPIEKETQKQNDQNLDFFNNLDEYKPSKNQKPENNLNQISSSAMEDLNDLFG